MENLNLTIRKGEIFALLGHNSAGKSTTINMLVGCLQPTFGTASMFKRVTYQLTVAAIQGLSIDDEMDSIRQNMGVCLQEDLIFDKLTAQEHLELFAVLKGVPVASQAADIEHALKQVDLYDDKDRYAIDFSGGMKRKLSFAISMLGDSSVIILDERMIILKPLTCCSNKWIGSCITSQVLVHFTRMQKAQDHIINNTFHGRSRFTR